MLEYNCKLSFTIIINCNFNLFFPCYLIVENAILNEVQTNPITNLKFKYPALPLLFTAP